MNARVVVATVIGLLLCLTAGLSAAQPTWEIGVKGGVGLAKLTGDTGLNASFTDGVDTIDLTGDIGDSRTGFTGGGFAAAQFSEAFGLRLEVLYAQKGGKGPLNVAFNGNPAGTADVTFKLDYIELPILAVGTFPAGSGSRVNVFGGPTIAFNTGSNIKTEAQGQSDEQDIGDTVEGTDFGFAAGAGLKFAATPKMNIVVDGRYTFGFSKIPTTGEDIKNGGMSFMAGLSFPLGGSSTP
jgi:opacity protein-like surface antigen